MSSQWISEKLETSIFTCRPASFENIFLNPDPLLCLIKATNCLYHSSQLQCCDWTMFIVSATSPAGCCATSRTASLTSKRWPDHSRLCRSLDCGEFYLEKCKYRARFPATVSFTTRRDLSFRGFLTSAFSSVKLEQPRCFETFPEGSSDVSGKPRQELPKWCMTAYRPYTMME